ncbi:MAG: hypothetical protein WCR52_17235 [Bacteroidota bacterium]
MLKKQVYLSLVLLFWAGSLCAQSILVVDPVIPPATTISSLNLVTCETTVLAANLNLPERPRGICQMPDGNIYIICRNPSNINNSTFIFKYDLNTGLLENMLTVPAGSARAMIALNDSIIIIHTSFKLYEYNINQNTATFITALSGSYEFRSLFFYNGMLYGQNESGYIFQIQYPSGVVTSLNLAVGGQPATSVCNLVVLGNNSFTGGIGTLDWGNKSVNPLCYEDYNPANQGVYATDPFNSTGPLCDCTTESGTFANPYLSYNPCVPNAVTLPHNGNEVLDGNDNLVFVLGTYDMSGPEVKYNVVAYYTQPIIEFLPGVTEPNVPYTIFAIAADALGNGVDFDDLCLDAQNAGSIQWRAAPSVSFSLQSTCPSGCQMINLSFTGLAPFTLTYKTIAGTTQQSFTQTFNSSTGSIEVCPPPGYAGPITVQSLALTDAFCTCN